MTIDEFIAKLRENGKTVGTAYNYSKAIERLLALPEQTPNAYGAYIAAQPISAQSGLTCAWRQWAKFNPEAVTEALPWIAQNETSRRLLRIVDQQLRRHGGNGMRKLGARLVAISKLLWQGSRIQGPYLSVPLPHPIVAFLATDIDIHWRAAYGVTKRSWREMAATGEWNNYRPIPFFPAQPGDTSQRLDTKTIRRVLRIDEPGAFT